LVQGQPSHSAGGNKPVDNTPADNGGDTGSAGDHSDGAGGRVSDPSGGAGGDRESSAGESGEGGSAGGTVAEAGLITTELGCDSHNITGATLISEPITQDTVWTGVIYLPKGLSMRNEPTLTITPGTRIIVGHDATIEFGWPGGGHATIVAAGTVDEPIMFCGETDTAGYWAGMVFRSGVKSTSVLRNVLIADAGGTDAALTLEMPLLVQGVQVRNSGTNGVNTVGFAPKSSTLIVSGAAKTAVKITRAKGAEVPVGSQLTGNGIDMVDLAFSTVDANVSLRNVGVPYALAGLQITAGASLTLQPGVQLLVAQDSSVSVLSGATLNASGNPEAKVEFRALNSAHWGSISAELGASVLLDYAVIDRAGGGVLNGAVLAAAPIQLTHSTISNSSTWGLKKASTDSTDYLSGNTFAGNVSGDVTDL